MRRSFTRALAATLALALVSAATVVARDPGGPGRDALLAELGRDRTSFDDETGALTFVGGTTARPAASRARLGATANPRAAARAFMDRYGTLFGVRDASRDLHLARTSRAFGGGTFVRFEQLLGGLPVIAGQLTVQVDDGGNVLSAIGEATAAGLASTQPRISFIDAAAQAIALAARNGGHPRSVLTTSEPRLAVYDPRLVGAPAFAGTRLVWQLEVSSSRVPLREYVLVDATSGAIALHFDVLGHALDREVCDSANDMYGYPCTSPALEDDPPGSSAIADVNAAFDYAGDFYDFFQSRFGRDSFDGLGQTLTATVRYCYLGSCGSPNAFWDGEQTVFWPGMATDDIVGHEFAHAFTQYTSGLFYYDQSGAINEALSDIFGELIDQTNGGTDPVEDDWLMGEDSIALAIRDMSDPPAFNQPDRMTSGMYYGGDGDSRGVHTNSGVANKAAYLMVAGDTFNGQTIAGLGIDQTAAIWYRVASEYLGSGSDYVDLGLALSQACTDLIGVAPAGDLIVEADCDEVDKVVLATEMATLPTAPGASAPVPPTCTSGAYSEVWRDEIDSGLPGWTVQSRWIESNEYVANEPPALRGTTPAATGQSTASLDLTPGTLGADTFLNVRHAHIFDNWAGFGFDGGVVEYRIGSGTWQDAGGLFTHNGYNGTITAAFNSTNPLRGRAAYVAYSPGWMTSRLDLSNLAGQDVQLRFRTATDNVVEDYGWFIDELLLYQCAGAVDTAPPTVSPPNANLRTNVALTGTKPIKLRVTFGASDDSGLSSTALQRRTDNGTYSAVALSSATATSADLAYKVNTTARRQFRARATDTNALVSPWATGDPFRILAYQDGASPVLATSPPGTSWKKRSSSSFFGGTARSSDKAGALQRLTLNASDFAIVSTRGPNRGRFDVYVDGAYVQTVDLYASTTQYRQVVFAVDFGSPGAHTIELRVTHTKSSSSAAYRVDFDAFLALAP